MDTPQATPKFSDLKESKKKHTEKDVIQPPYLPSVGAFLAPLGYRRPKTGEGEVFKYIYAPSIGILSRMKQKKGKGQKGKQKGLEPPYFPSVGTLLAPLKRMPPKTGKEEMPAIEYRPSMGVLCRVVQRKAHGGAAPRMWLRAPRRLWFEPSYTPGMDTLQVSLNPIQRRRAMGKLSKSLARRQRPPIPDDAFQTFSAGVPSIMVTNPDGKVEKYLGPLDSVVPTDVVTDEVGKTVKTLYGSNYVVERQVRASNLFDDSDQELQPTAAQQTELQSLLIGHSSALNVQGSEDTNRMDIDVDEERDISGLGECERDEENLENADVEEMELDHDGSRVDGIGAEDAEPAQLSERRLYEMSTNF